jgi:hypothetical protein
VAYGFEQHQKYQTGKPDVEEEMKIDDGGPAFPIGSGDMRDPQRMSLRDYFIAHAPAEPQYWFVPEMPPQPDWIMEEGRCTNRQALDDHEREYNKQRFVQWPAAWADEQIEARKR